MAWGIFFVIQNRETIYRLKGAIRCGTALYHLSIIRGALRPLAWQIFYNSGNFCRSCCWHVPKDRKSFFARLCIFYCFSRLCSATLAVMLKVNSAPIFIDDQSKEIKSLFETTRMEQISKNSPDLYEPLQNFETLVPQQASVAVVFNEVTPSSILYLGGI